MQNAHTRAPALPERIVGLADLACNLWWSWDRAARSLFRGVNGPLWHLTRHNPIELLRRTDAARLGVCAQDPQFLALYDQVHDRFTRTLRDGDTWFAARYPDRTAGPVAYFCAEFGLHNSVPIYAGGLGILAGDHCKAASDLGVPFMAVGLLYTKGYFDQRVRADGWQEDAAESFDFALTPLARVTLPDGNPAVASVRAHDRTVHVGAWRMMVGRVPVYLLDTDLEQNDEADRQVTHRLYASGEEHRLRQEWILGVGGVRLLRALGIAPAAWHANEGHAAFMLVERLRELTAGGTAWDDAVRRIRATSIFTTHTPVPAGHDVFTHEQVVACAGPIWDEMGTDQEALLRLGHYPEVDHARFHMTAAAIRLCAHVNGVAERHGVVTRRMWQVLWPGREPPKVPIGHVTNGVHVATWVAHPMQDLLSEHLGPEWLASIDEPDLWDRVLQLDPDRLWTVHLELKGVLLDYMAEEARQRWRDEWDEGPRLVAAGTLLNAGVMTIGFARRFATYKRADLLFRDPDRLAALVTDADRPVQLIFAGKAHPADDHGKYILQQVYTLAHDRRFEGRIAFLEDYEMHMAHRLVQGVDLWLNVPRVPLEACGTSGIKAALNGVPQLSTADGWWAEGFTGLNGWQIPSAEGTADADAADAERLYTLLEREVVPEYYDRDLAGIPVRWVERMRHAIHVAGRRFTAGGMVRRYADDYYVPAMAQDAAGDDPPTA